MQKRTETTSENNKPKTLGFLNVDVKVQAENGEWYSYKGGIPLTDKKASERGLVANPSVIENTDRVQVTASIHVIEEEPENVAF